MRSSIASLQVVRLAALGAFAAIAASRAAVAAAIIGQDSRLARLSTGYTLLATIVVITFASGWPRSSLDFLGSASSWPLATQRLLVTLGSGRSHLGLPAASSLYLRAILLILA